MAAMRWMSWWTEWTVTQGPQFRQGRTTGALKGSAMNTSAHPQPGPLGQSPVPPLSWLPSLGMGGGSGLMDVCRGRNPCYEHPQ